MNDGVKFSKAKLLAEGWQWKMYDDGSGHLENADGKSYFSFDIETQEYVNLNNKWRFMSEYPDFTSYEKFKAEMEIDIVSSGLAEPSEQFKKVVDLQNKLFDSEKCNSLFSYSSYTNMYNRTDEMYQVLLDYEKALEDENSLDLDMINRLSEFYSKYAICDLLSESHKEILVDAVEMERDWGNDISSEVYSVYDLICMEQGESEGAVMQM